MSKAPINSLPVPYGEKEAEAVKNALGICGHINKQHYNMKGELEDLVCTLPERHAPVLIRIDKIKNEKGEIEEKEIWAQVHSAEYVRLKADIIPPLKQRVEGKPITYKKVIEKGEWLDGAGVPA